MIPASSATLEIAGVLALGFLCQLLAWRWRLPGLLLMLLAGGGLAHALDLDLAGKNPMELYRPAIGIGLALILFESGQSLNRAPVQVHQHELKHLIAWGTKLGWVFASLLAVVLLQLDAPRAFVLGAVMLIQAPYAVRDHTNRLRAREEVARVLTWESFVVACVGVAWAVLAATAVKAGTDRSHPSLLATVKATLICLAVGALFGALAYRFVLLLRRRAPDPLVNTGSVAVLLLAFGAAQTAWDGAGVVAAGLAGYLAAKSDPSERRFLFSQDLMLLTTAFLGALFGLYLPWPAMAAHALPCLAYALCLVLVLRPLLSRLALRHTALPARERRIIALVAPRGMLTIAVMYVITMGQTAALSTVGMACVYWMVVVSNLVPALLKPFLGPPPGEEEPASA